MYHRSPGEGGDVAALVSGGSDSAVLAVDLLRTFGRVWPIYILFGLRWEEAELSGLREFLDAVERPGLMPLTVLDEPVAEVYGDHWSTGGRGVPDAESPDEDVYLPGRTLLLAAKAAVWSGIRGIEALAIGTLASNPFPDSTPEFDRAFEAVVGGRFRLLRPFAGLEKADVLRRGTGLPLWLTFSCLDPVEGRHCGRCNKCAERRRGFGEQGRADRTDYAAAPVAPQRRPVPCTE
ncbi:MAG TPA: 7-cyano-7-deazaguanine synthase [Isosphaeraceae bacterium]